MDANDKTVGYRIAREVSKMRQLRCYSALRQWRP